MVEYLIIAAKDELTDTFLQPTFIETEKEAIRMFRYQINNTPIWKDNPSDYSLYQLGYYNKITGEMKSDIKKIISGHTVREVENVQEV